MAAAVTGTLAHRVQPLWLVIGGYAVSAVALLITNHTPHFAVALGLAALSAVAAGAYGIGLQTLLQAEVVDAFRGRVLAAMDTTVALAMLAGTGAASVLGDPVGVIPLYDFAGGTRLVAALLLVPLVAGILRPTTVRGLSNAETR